MVMPVVGRPPQHTLLGRGLGAEREDELEAAARPEASVREMLVVPPGDEEDPPDERDHEQDEGGPADPGEHGGQTHDVNQEEAGRGHPIDPLVPPFGGHPSLAGGHGPTGYLPAGREAISAPGPPPGPRATVPAAGAPTLGGNATLPGRAAGFFVSFRPHWAVWVPSLLGSRRDRPSVRSRRPDRRRCRRRSHDGAWPNGRAAQTKEPPWPRNDRASRNASGNRPPRPRQLPSAPAGWPE